MLEAIAAIQERCLIYAKEHKETDNNEPTKAEPNQNKPKIMETSTSAVFEYQNRVLTLDKINTTESNIDWLIEGILARGSSMLLSGLSGSGKSPLLSYLAKCLVTGDDFLGHTTKKSKVLYVYGDELEAEGNFKDRLNKLGLTEHLNKDFIAVAHIGIEETDAWEYFVSEYKPDVVILDSLTYAYLNLDINENQAEWIKPIERVKQLLHKHDATLIAVHHDNKNSKAAYNNRVAGTSRLVSRFSTVLRLEAFESASITSTGRRLSGKVKFGSNIDIKLDCDFENCEFHHQGDYEATEEAPTRKNTIKDKLVQTLQNHGGRLSRTELKEKLEVSDDSFRKALSRAKSDNAIETYQKEETECIQLKDFVEPDVAMSKANTPPPENSLVEEENYKYSQFTVRAFAYTGNRKDAVLEGKRLKYVYPEYLFNREEITVNCIDDSDFEEVVPKADLTEVFTQQEFIDIFNERASRFSKQSKKRILT
jgi:RecA-family ATPase